MDTETVAWILLLIGIATAVFIFTAIIILLRSRKRTHEDDESAELSLTEIDEAANAALNEINKTSQMILDDIDEKYQAMLFLYDLLEEKKKEIASLTEPVRPAAPVRTKTAVPFMTAPTAPVRASGGNTRHMEIKKLYKTGMSIPEIAKKLNMGQGEVKLILDLAKP